MKASHTIAISATVASPIVIGMNYAPITTYDIVGGFLFTVLIALSIAAINQLILGR